MANFFNMLTQPLGIKLFKGGPYADGGAGDRMEANSQQYLQQLGPIIAQIAQMAGIPNPQTMPNAPTGNPYAMSQLQEQQLNQQNSIDTEAYGRIMQRVKANLSARGMGDSSTMVAAETYLKQQLATQMGQNRLAAGESAYAGKQNAFQQIAQLLGSGFGAQQQVTAQQGQTATEASGNAMRQLGTLLGMYAGGVFGGKSAPAGTPPFAGGGAPQFGGQPKFGPITLSGAGGSGWGGGSIYGR